MLKRLIAVILASFLFVSPSFAFTPPDGKDNMIMSCWASGKALADNLKEDGFTPFGRVGAGIFFINGSGAVLVVVPSKDFKLACIVFGAEDSDFHPGLDFSKIFEQKLSQ